MLEAQESASMTHLADLPHVLSVTETGSTMWGMAHADSDVDYHCVWAQDPRHILDGSHSEAQRNHRNVMVRHEYPGADKPEMQAAEISHHVYLLMGGNINAIQATLSPRRIEWTPDMESLAAIVRRHPARNIYASTSGMNSKNMARYIRRMNEGETFTAKKAGQILRAVNTSIRVLEGKPYTFDAVHDATFEDCQQALVDLKIAYENSNLPDKPPVDVYRDWVFQLRMRQLNAQLTSS